MRHGLTSYDAYDSPIRIQAISLPRFAVRVAGADQTPHHIAIENIEVSHVYE
jgi:hypothetical protein